MLIFNPDCGTLALDICYLRGTSTLWVGGGTNANYGKVHLVTITESSWLHAAAAWPQPLPVSADPLIR